MIVMDKKLSNDSKTSAFVGKVGVGTGESNRLSWFGVQYTFLKANVINSD